MITKAFIAITLVSSAAGVSSGTAEQAERQLRNGGLATAGAGGHHGRLGGTTYNAGAAAGGYHQGPLGRHGSAGGAGAGVHYRQGPLGNRHVSAGGAAGGGSYHYNRQLARTKQR